MRSTLITLNSLPLAAEFYQLYWNQKPFVVRAAIARCDMQGFITADELAGLSMEEEPQSRMVKTAGAHKGWSCRYGPFSEDDFKTAGDTDWSLLVQNVEQFHPKTASLLQHFKFAPRWLMDDIMVGYSAPRGSVGPHLDSYHVFLVQGQGVRRWKVGRTPIQNDVYIDGIDLKILKDDFVGDEIEMTCGDVLYVPPKFAHEGITLESALTFSVGFLGPNISELMSAYGASLAACEGRDQRYVGADLKEDSAGASISSATVHTLQDMLVRHINADAFSSWLVEFFTQSSHEDFGHYTKREDSLSKTAFSAKLKQGLSLHKPHDVKFALTATPNGGLCLGFDSRSFTLDASLEPMVQLLAQERVVNTENTPALLDTQAYLDVLRDLYNHSALEFMAPRSS